VHLLEHADRVGIAVEQLYAKVYEDGPAYWKAKHDGLSDDNYYHHINWESLCLARKRIPLGQQRWLLKHATGHCGVGKMMTLQGHQDHSRCPRCGEDNETTLHLLTCQDP
jgi:hypothetical protein